MKNKMIIIAFLTFIGAGAIAQPKDAFKVLATRGNNTVINTGTSTAVPLTLGAKLYENQEISLQEGGYLSLIHLSGKSLELKKGGKYQVDDLVKNLQSNQSGMAAKYANFVLGELTKNDQDINKEHRKNMTVTGSVERSTGSDAIRVNLPKSLVIWDKSLPIQISNGSESETGYHFVVMNLFEEKIAEGDFKGTVQTINFPDNKDLEAQGALLQISSMSNPALKSSMISIRLPDAGTRSKIEGELAMLQQELPEQNATNKLVMATYFEEKKLFLEAYKSYQSALAMEPEVEAFRIAFEQFLKRNGL
jgi:hypothetical protein